MKRNGDLLRQSLFQLEEQDDWLIVESDGMTHGMMRGPAEPLHGNPIPEHIRPQIMPRQQNDVANHDGLGQTSAWGFSRCAIPPAGYETCPQDAERSLISW